MYNAIPAALRTPAVIVHQLLRGSPDVEYFGSGRFPAGKKGVSVYGNSTHLSSEKASAQQGSRFPCENEDCQRPQGPVRQTRKRQSRHQCLSFAFSAGNLKQQFWGGAIHPCGIYRVFPEETFLNARNTLKKNSDFRRLYTKGKSAVTPYVVVYCRKNGLPVNRTGFTVSAKLGNAVTRNRIRRQFREIYRLHMEELKPGQDIVLVARSRCVRGDYRKMENSFLSACRSLSLLSGQEGGL